MGYIFDDEITKKGIENYEHFNNLKNYNKNNGFYKLDNDLLSNNIKKDKMSFSQFNHTCFMLSYGDSDRVAPVGTFVVIGYQDAEGKSITEEEASLNDGYVVCAQIELVNNHVINCSVKKGGDKIIMPYHTYSKLCLSADYNTLSFMSIIPEDDINPILVEAVGISAGRRFANDPKLSEIPKVDFHGMSLDEAEATVINANGASRGTNYTIVPFEYEIIKRLEKIKNYNKESEKGKDELYKNYNWLGDYQEKPKLEPEQDIPTITYYDGGRSR